MDDMILNINKNSYMGVDLCSTILCYTQLYTNLGTMKHVDDISKIAKCLNSIPY